MAAVSSMSRCGTVKRFTSLVLAAVLLVAGALAPATAQAATQTMQTFIYALDWSQVPPWVVHRELTLVVTVGQAEGAVVLGDGVPLWRSFDRSAGTVTFTTGASRVEVRAWGTDPAQPGLGAVRKAALRGDKKWAYSLTLDDGYASQHTNGLRFLGPYGYQATVAVVGKYLDQATDGSTYATAAQLRALQAAGWGLSNHTYNHRYVSQFGSTAQVISDINAATQSIMNAVPGYRPLVFTAPYVDTAYNPIIAANVEALGLRLLQTLGYEAVQVDRINFSPSYFMALGRTQVLHSGSQFDDMHRRAVERPGEHWWLSLHSHAVEDVCDCTETSTSHLYETYGAGGTDEVWVAPAETVYQYLVVRERVQVTSIATALTDQSVSLEPGQVSARGLPAAVGAAAARTVSLQNGLGGYAGAADTYIDPARPTSNFVLEWNMRLRTGWGSVGLLRFDTASIPQNSRVLDARLELWTGDNSGNYACMSAYPLLVAWNPGQATWLRRDSANAWTAGGAAAIGSDRSGTPTDVRRFVSGTGVQFTLDVTDAVQTWVNDPERNYGLVLALERYTDLWFHIYGTDHPTISRRPRLVVTYLPPGQAMLSGRVLFQGRGPAPNPALAEPLEVVLRVPGQKRVAYRATPTADLAGRFSLADLAPGTYDLYVRGRHSLWTVLRGVELPLAGELIVGPLREGDIDRDGLVGKGDLDLLQASYRTLRGQPGYDAQADLNGDGAVNIHDFSLLAANYGRQSEALP